MRLGTVTRLIHRNEEFDLDVVCRHDLEKSDTTKADLKADVGKALEAFAESRPDLGLDLDDEGRRCWTFKHAKLPFHMDVLPAIPNEKAQPDGIWVTDTEAHQWHPSAPTAYADWFHDVQKPDWEEKAKVLAASRDMDIQALPRHAVKTNLQRTVQALKRHRDNNFLNDAPGLKPASIIITTLAARAYEPVGNLFQVLCHVVDEMPGLVESTPTGHHLITNPVQEGENFADRWKGHPERSRAFSRWMKQAQLDLQELSATNGVPEILAKTASMLGPGPARAAEHAVGDVLRQARLMGDLTMSAATGYLTVGGSGTRVPAHDFHGDQ